MYTHLVRYINTKVGNEIMAATAPYGPKMRFSRREITQRPIMVERIFGKEDGSLPLSLGNEGKPFEL